MTRKIAAFIEQEIRRICEANIWTIGALNVQEDHVHLFLSAPPSVAPSQIAHILKGTTFRRAVDQRRSASSRDNAGRAGALSRDEMGYENLPEYLGYLVGYLGGPLAPEEAEHYRNQQTPQEYLCSSVRA